MSRRESTGQRNHVQGSAFLATDFTGLVLDYAGAVASHSRLPLDAQQEDPVDGTGYRLKWYV